jgi:hypothetical protein
MNREIRDAANQARSEDTEEVTHILPVHFPFYMRTKRRVHIELEPFWDYTRQWAQAQGYVKTEGHYQSLPPT